MCSRSISETSAPSRSRSLVTSASRSYAASALTAPGSADAGSARPSTFARSRASDSATSGASASSAWARSNASSAASGSNSCDSCSSPSRTSRAAHALGSAAYSAIERSSAFARSAWRPRSASASISASTAAVLSGAHAVARSRCASACCASPHSRWSDAAVSSASTGTCSARAAITRSSDSSNAGSAALARERGEPLVELGGVRSRLDAAADPGPRRARVVQLALFDLGELERDRRAFGVRGRDLEAARLEQREAHPVALTRARGRSARPARRVRTGRRAARGAIARPARDRGHRPRIPAESLPGRSSRTPSARLPIEKRSPSYRPTRRRP